MEKGRCIGVGGCWFANSRGNVYYAIFNDYDPAPRLYSTPVSPSPHMLLFLFISRTTAASWTNRSGMVSCTFV